MNTEQKLKRAESLLRAFALNMDSLLAIPATEEQLRYRCKVLLSYIPHEYQPETLLSETSTNNAPDGVAKGDPGVSY